jgi:hypothetical protein
LILKGSPPERRFGSVSLPGANLYGMRVFLLFLLIFAFPCFVTAQLEAKLNLLQLYRQGAGFSGEWILRDRLSLETSLNYRWAPIRQANVLPAESYKARRLQAAVGGKIYPFPRKGGDGFFFGLSVHHESVLWIEETYPNPRPRPQFGLGGSIGGKFILADRWILEPGCYLTTLLVDKPGNTGPVFEMDFMLFWRVGYRFF